jgi:hypothetical protein
MMRAVPPALAYLLLALGLVLATAPLWRLALFGFSPTLDDLLRLRCFGL